MSMSINIPNANMFLRFLFGIQVEVSFYRIKKEFEKLKCWLVPANFAKENYSF